MSDRALSRVSSMSSWMRRRRRRSPRASSRAMTPLRKGLSMRRSVLLEGGERAMSLSHRPPGNRADDAETLRAIGQHRQQDYGQSIVLYRPYAAITPSQLKRIAAMAAASLASATLSSRRATSARASPVRLLCSRKGREKYQRDENCIGVQTATLGSSRASLRMAAPSSFISRTRRRVVAFPLSTWQRS